MIMLNKKQILQFALVLFIIGFTSCKKKIDYKYPIQYNNIPKDNSDGPKINKNIKFILLLNDEFTTEYIKKLAKRFLRKTDFSDQVAHPLFYIYDEDESNFIETYTHYDIIENLNVAPLDLIGNHLITENNTDEEDVNIYKVRGVMDIIGGLTTVIVSTREL